MKHLLNNLSNEEKNRIREQYKGGVSLDNSKFKKLMESKLEDVKPIISQQELEKTKEDVQKLIDNGFYDKLQQILLKRDEIEKLHTFKSGDTISGIALKYHTDVETLKSLNPQIEDINKINVGDTINLPK